LVHFAPPVAGTWKWSASFRTGQRVALTVSGGNGRSGGFFDGAAGSFVIQPTDKQGVDFRGKGVLNYVNNHYYQFEGTKEWFLKAGSDSPENFLAYQDFDNTPSNGGFRKNWAPHIRDFRPGNPTWGNGKGRGMIGG